MSGTGRLRAWVRNRRIALELGLRVAVAVALTFALGKLLDIPLVVWAVLTAVIVTEANVGKSLKTTIEYLIGTLGGAVIGGGVALLIPHRSDFALAVALAIAVAPLAFLAATSPNFRVAPFTAVLVILAPTFAHVDPSTSAISRVMEVALGCAVGLMVSFLLLPTRAEKVARDAAAHMLDVMARVIPELFTGFTQSLDPSTIARIQNDVGHAFAVLDVAGAEAKSERIAPQLAGPDPEPLLRTLLRLRHDLIVIGRSAAEPLPSNILTHLGAPLMRVAKVAAEYMRACGAALATHRGPPQLDDLKAAHADFATEMQALRSRGLTRDLPVDTVERIFALGFAVDQLSAHLEDLRRCVKEWAR